MEPGPLQCKRCPEPWAAREAPDTVSWTVGSTCAAHNRRCLRAMPLGGGVNNHTGIGGADGRPARPLLRVCLEGWTGRRAAHVCPGSTQRPGLLCPSAAWRVVVLLGTFHKAVVARQRAAAGGKVSGVGSINLMIVYAHTHTHTHTHTREIYRKMGQRPQTLPAPPELLGHCLDRLPEALQRLGPLPSSLLASQLRPPEAALSSSTLLVQEDRAKCPSCPFITNF